MHVHRSEPDATGNLAGEGVTNGTVFAVDLQGTLATTPEWRVGIADLRSGLLSPVARL